MQDRPCDHTQVTKHKMTFFPLPAEIFLMVAQLFRDMSLTYHMHRGEPRAAYLRQPKVTLVLQKVPGL